MSKPIPNYMRFGIGSGRSTGFIAYGSRGLFFGGEVDRYEECLHVPLKTGDDIREAALALQQLARLMLTAVGEEPE
jgi:hypothetical protein